MLIMSGETLKVGQLWMLVKLWKSLGVISTHCNILWCTVEYVDVAVVWRVSTSVIARWCASLQLSWH